MTMGNITPEGQLKGRILLAEDDEDMRRFLAKALENAGYQVVSFDNGQSAYERLREEPFNLLLTDIVMPQMDGIELARKAAELDPDLKIMFITGFAAVALNADLEAPKDAKILSKPFHLRDLVSEVVTEVDVLGEEAPLRRVLVVGSSQRDQLRIGAEGLGHSVHDVGVGAAVRVDEEDEVRVHGGGAGVARPGGPGRHG